jgi:hypothetical protein
MTALVGQEFELFRVEMGEKRSRSGRRLGEGGGMFSAAAICALRGEHTIDHVVMPVPKQTVKTVKEDIEWAKTQATSAKK